MSAFDDAQLRSDYGFLEEGSQVVARHVREGTVHGGARLPRRMQDLVRRARHAGVKLVLLPVGMSRREQNTSRFDKKEGCIQWRVEWRWGLSSAIDPRVNESASLMAAAEAHRSELPETMRQAWPAGVEFFLRDDGALATERAQGLDAALRNDDNDDDDHDGGTGGGGEEEHDRQLSSASASKGRAPLMIRIPDASQTLKQILVRCCCMREDALAIFLVTEEGCTRTHHRTERLSSNTPLSRFESGQL